MTLPDWNDLPAAVREAMVTEAGHWVENDCSAGDAAVNIWGEAQKAARVARDRNAIADFFAPTASATDAPEPR